MNAPKRIPSLLCFIAVTLVPVASSTWAANPEELPIWPGIAPGSEEYEAVERVEGRGENNRWVTQVSRPTLTIYRPGADKRSGAAVVVCPGGGYGGLALDKEGHAMAQWFQERGILGAVLKYRCNGGPHQHPVPLSDAQRAMQIVRSRAEELKIDPEKIGIVGFSAGGHLASSAGTHVKQGNPDASEAAERVSSKANFLVLVYPVISMELGVTHGGSRKNLLGDRPSDELVKEMSNHLQVTSETAPTFLLHASDDRAVPVQNSLGFYEALVKNDVPAEMHIFQAGGHGFGFYRGDRPVDRWPDLLEAWLQQRDLIR